MRFIAGGSGGVVVDLYATQYYYCRYYNVREWKYVRCKCVSRRCRRPSLRARKRLVRSECGIKTLDDTV